MINLAGVELPLARRRLLGMGVMVIFALALAGAHLWRWQRRSAVDLSEAYGELAAAVEHPAEVRVHAQRAQELLAQASGSVLMDPEALLALQVAEQLPVHLGQPVPTAPSNLEVEAIVAHAEALLASGRPVEAVSYLRQPDVARHHHASLHVVERVAERWQAALQHRNGTQHPRNRTSGQ